LCVAVGLVRFGLAWLGLGLIWFGLVWVGLAWVGLAWVGLGWFGGTAGGHSCGLQVSSALGLLPERVCGLRVGYGV
jgi:hypothetical protein